MKFLTLNKLNENLRSFFDTIILPTIKQRKIIVWDKLQNRSTLENGTVENPGTLVGERYSYVSEALTLNSKGKKIKIYNPDGSEDFTGIVSIEAEGTESASLIVFANSYCFKIKGSY